MNAWGSSWASAWGSSWGGASSASTSSGRGKQAKHDDDLIQKVLDKWETIDEIRAVPAEQAFQEIVTQAPEKVQKQAQRIVRKYTAPQSQTDWSALQASVRDTKKLLALWRETQMVHDDDEEIIMSEFF